MSLVDRTDKKILDILKEDGRISYSDLAKEIGLSDVAAKNRMKRLEENNIIKSYKPVINFKQLGYNFEAFLNIKTNAGSTSKVANVLQKDKRVLEVHYTVGEFDIVARIISINTEGMKEFVDNVISILSGVLEVRTSLVFNTTKG